MHINFYLNEKNYKVVLEHLEDLDVCAQEREVKWTIFNRNVVIFFYNYQINLKVTTVHFYKSSPWLFVQIVTTPQSNHG